MSARKLSRAIPVNVRVEVDRGIAELVRDLQSFDGIWTHASCEGGKGHSFRPYVMVSWDSEKALDGLLSKYDVTLPTGTNRTWGYIYPVTGTRSTQQGR